MIKITVDGEPIPAARPRYSVRRVYQPKRNAEYRRRVQASARSAMSGAEPMTGALSPVALFKLNLTAAIMIVSAFVIRARLEPKPNMKNCTQLSRYNHCVQ